MILKGQIHGLGETEALVLTVEGQKREVAAHAFVEKPPLLKLVTTPYEEPPVPATPPPTIWEEREQAHAAPATGQRRPTPAAGLPAPRQTPDW